MGGDVAAVAVVVEVLEVMVIAETAHGDLRSVIQRCVSVQPAFFLW